MLGSLILSNQALYVSSARPERGAAAAPPSHFALLTEKSNNKQAEGSNRANHRINSLHQGLLRADAGWTALRNMKTGDDAGPAPAFVTESDAPLGGGGPVFDVVVCGGTLGIFVATALQMK